MLSNSSPCTTVAGYVVVSATPILFTAQVEMLIIPKSIYQAMKRILDDKLVEIHIKSLCTRYSFEEHRK